VLVCTAIAGRLELLLKPLLRNASSRAWKVSLSLTAEPRVAHFCVGDDGAGLHRRPAIILLEPFYTNKSPGEGHRVWPGYRPAPSPKDIQVN